MEEAEEARLTAAMVFAAFSRVEVGDEETVSVALLNPTGAVKFLEISGTGEEMMEKTRRLKAEVFAWEAQVMLMVAPVPLLFRVDGKTALYHAVMVLRFSPQGTRVTPHFYQWLNGEVHRADPPEDWVPPRQVQGELNPWSHVQ